MTQTAPDIRSSVTSDAHRRHGKDQWAVLAALRFVLALIVLFAHSRIAVRIPENISYFLGPRDAVLAFLLISGYSIAASVAREEHRYYQRRARRILPVYAVAIVLPAVVYVLFGKTILCAGYGPMQSNHLTSLIGSTFLLQGFAVGPFNYNIPIWSLSVECFCYAFAPMLNRMKTAPIIGVILVSMALFVVHRLHDPSFFDHEKYGIPAFCLAWAWLVGFLAWRCRTSIAAKAALVLVPTGLAWFDPNFNFGAGLCTVFASAVILGAAPMLTIPKWCTKPFIHLGDLSYPLYLVHYPFMLIVISIAHREGVNSLPLAAVILLCIAMGEAVFWLVDYPARKLKFGRLSLSDRDAAN